MKPALPSIVAVLILCLTVFISVTVSQQPDSPIGFGMDAASIHAQTQAGVKPDYGTLWIGPWTLQTGWSGPGATLTTLKNAGVTPAIHFYYWGDDISPSCVENGCWSDLHKIHKDRDGWNTLAQQLVENLHKRMDGKPVLVFMETEFNKNRIDDHPPFDEYLAEMSRSIKEGYPAASTVMALGNWNRNKWSNFAETAQASDYIGIQAMRGSTRDSLSSYRSAYEDTLHGVERMKKEFGKPIIILDIALSSYPEPEFLDHQADVLENFFTAMEPLEDAGVKAIMYRSWFDSPTKDTNNYYGIAERHWGLQASSGPGVKPAGQVWIAGIQSVRSGTPYESPLGEDRRFEVTFNLASNINEWWVETYASGTKPLHRVQASVDGGKWRTLNPTDWGSWAASFNAPKGSQMILRATSLQGDTASTFPFAWMQEQPRFDDSAHRSAHPVMDITTDGLHASFDASGSWDPYGREPHFTWDLGDGTHADGAQLVHTYKTSGTYHVTLTVDNGAVRNSTTQTITVQVPPPHVHFQATAELLEVHLDATQTQDPKDRGLSYTWDLGDGNTTLGETARHTYAQSGTYHVILAVDNGEATNSTSQDITVEAPPPEATFTYSTDGLEVRLDASGSHDPAGRPLQHTWDLGDGTQIQGAQIVHTYTKSGTYTATLSVANNEAQTTTSQNIFVVAPPPAASFSAHKDGLHVSLDGTGSHDPQGRPLEYTWDLGDGTRLHGEQVEHTYPHEGTYTVRLTVSNGEHENSTHREIRVRPEHPPLDAGFRVGSGVNEWWVEVYVDANNPLSRVQARTDGGSWRTLSPTDWGSWAASYHIPTGSQVEFRATDAHGQRIVFEPIHWLGEPDDGPENDDGPEKLAASFRASDGANEWWIEIYVDANNPLTRVQARSDGGSWRTLSPTDWDSWAASYHIPTGSTVEFRATDAHGQRIVFEPIHWLGEPDSGPDPANDPAALEAGFRLGSGVNNWWVEVYVDANNPLSRVQARTDGGSWRTLLPTDWDSWAASYHNPTGSQVEFRATDTHGQRIVSAAHTWP